MPRSQPPRSLLKALISARMAHMSPQASTAAPWRDVFLKHVQTMSQPTFVLSSLHPVPASELATPAPLPASLPVVPRARTCIFRGLWTELPPNDHNKAPRNPTIWASDLPVLTTDARMEKAAELADTGGGGPVEAVWWAEETANQWRVRGTAWILGSDVEDDAAKPAREAILSRMRRVSGAEGDDGGWSWKRELTAHFGNLSPFMRGTFRNPPPGSPLAIPPQEGHGLGQQVQDLEDELARANFRVVVILPTEVDQADLSDQKRPRRWLYTYRGLTGKSLMPGGEMLGEWEKVEVWP